jgi:hypothetical protein
LVTVFLVTVVDKVSTLTLGVSVVKLVVSVGALSVLTSVSVLVLADVEESTLLESAEPPEPALLHAAIAMAIVNARQDVFSAFFIYVDNVWCNRWYNHPANIMF